eukprot:NODE_376_length_8513_cov_1.020086.p9 type:complete len:116 gc:universal NODE_376_length_8513_cov_1.020086:2307-2654(+)
MPQEVIKCVKVNVVMLTKDIHFNHQVIRNRVLSPLNKQRNLQLNHLSIFVVLNLALHLFTMSIIHLKIMDILAKSVAPLPFHPMACMLLSQSNACKINAVKFSQSLIMVNPLPCQ